MITRIGPRTGETLLDAIDRHNAATRPDFHAKTLADREQARDQMRLAREARERAEARGALS